MKESSKAAPPSQRVIVSGKLDLSPGNDRDFILTLVSGESLRGRLPSGDRQAYASLVGGRVVVDGEVRFRASGAVSVVIASFIQPARPEDEAWQRVPRPRPRCLDELQPRTPASPGSNRMDLVFGHWPGDETMEELLAALEEMS